MLNIIALLIGLALFLLMAPVFIFLLVMFIIYKIYESLYFRSKKFNQIKEEIEAYVNECNDLNQHIEELKQSYVILNKKDYGLA
ncbi:hypothetical protein [Alkalithermobacter paradoxus]|uniref:Uncharacterized protein n=1 Tax=Alkalithermobacter paradoxus TaxID=29349 RepID=A0A1V4I948_9FIRM|nr:hypothetical protein CLOTH_08480 [[Clostridium] thermoalcaliphilum]